MKRQLFSTAKIFPLICLIIILLEILNLHPVSCIPNEPYNRCGAPFNCGELYGIGFPFWGGDRPAECGYAALKLDCGNGNTTTIQMNDVKYQVLSLNQKTKILKIARSDLLRSLCPPKLVSTTLDPRLFEYASSYMNLTILYGCPAINIPVPFQFECAVKGFKDKIGYVEFGSQMSGMCHAGVIVPVSYTSLFNFKDLQALIAEGFEVRFTADSSGCAACERSGGRCGFDDAGKKFVCFCSGRQTAESKACGGVVAAEADPPRNPSTNSVKQGPQTATAVPSESGTHSISFMLAVCLSKILTGMSLHYGGD